MEKQEALEWMEKNGAGLVVLRKDVGRITNGVLVPRTLANKDALGTGPKQRVKVFGRVAYPIDALAEYLAANTSTLN